ncbi:MAG: hypothetical protein AAF429_09115 [Pseudomonadota bacterium]
MIELWTNLAEMVAALLALIVIYFQWLELCRMRQETKTLHGKICVLEAEIKALK